MERPHKRHHLIQPPCAHCGEAVLTTAWNVPVFCHDDCADGWLAEQAAKEREAPPYPPRTPRNPEA
jgi:hypothetical protein